MPILGYTLRAHPLIYDQHMKKLAALAALPLALTACSSGSGDAASSPSSSSSTSETTSESPSESSTSADLSSQKLGDGVSVTDGESGKHAYDLTIKAFEQKVTVNYEYPDIIGIKSGEHWSRASVQVCPELQARVQWDSFSLIGSDGGTYSAGTTAMEEAFPKPMFPDRGVGIAPGPCRTGWVYFPIPDGVTATDITFQESTGASANWKTS